MSILQEILDWTQGLPTWQSDAVARLLAKQTLTVEDQNDLFALLKAAHGIPDPKDRKPKPLTADQIPAPVKATTHVELRAMKNMRHVNAIAENKHLAFGATGMTVIYGDNGSGKSGYSRVLKRACRAPQRQSAGRQGRCSGGCLRDRRGRCCQGRPVDTRQGCTSRTVVIRRLRFALRACLSRWRG